MADIKEISVPDIGDFQDVEVIEILVNVGDTIDAEDSIVSLESDKAAMEIPAPFGGLVKDIKISLGDKVSQGSALLVVEASDSSETASPVAAAEPSVEAPPTPPPAPVRAPGEKKHKPPPVSAAPVNTGKKAHASPSIRRFARELGVDLNDVSGSGPKHRVLKDDIQEFVKHRMSSPALGSSMVSSNLPGAVPEVDFSKFGDIEKVSLGRIKKISGAHLHRSWVNVPHVTQFDEADITELEDFRKQQKEVAAKKDIKLTFMPFLMKACAAALKAFPQVNSSLAGDGENLVLKQYVHIGIAVDTPNGLMVPVVRDVDKKSVFALAAELMELSSKARDGKLSPADLQGGCFSISSLGGIGGTQFTPIVNAPEVAILGVSRAEMKPVWDGSEFIPRLMMPFSLSYDHRVIDGAEGVRFTTYLGGLLTDIRTLIL